MNLVKITIFLIIIYYFISINKKKEFFYNFSCFDGNDYIYIQEINNIKLNLENDSLTSIKSYECLKLLEIYNTIVCDLFNKNLDELDIISLFDVEYSKNKLNYINNIFDSFKNKTEELIYQISNLSNNITMIRYINPNNNIILNLKNEFILKYI